jgi:gliding motility-associated peptidyl-prolyl isomerase
MMKSNSLVAIATLLCLALFSCKQHQDARRPISHASGSFMKKSIARNKKLIAGEEGQIQAVIKSNPKIKYIASTKGYWYSYETKNELDTLTPKKGDVAFFDYELKDIKGNVIYSELELKPQTYYVDKQNVMMGLRDGIKLMHKTEKVNFLFTSHMGYGYHGDSKRIVPNQPLLCTVTLHDFMPEAAYKSGQKPVTTAIQPESTVNKTKDTITQKN